MTRLARAANRRKAGIRVRLAFALALALAPILILSLVQSGLTFEREARLERGDFVASAERSAATARARIAASAVLLETLAPRSIGFQCAQRLAEVTGRLPGYVNVIRFDALGRVACSSATVPRDDARRTRTWFTSLAGGATTAISGAPGASYASVPAILAGVRAEDAAGRFDGVLAAVITLASLKPSTADSALPKDSDVALVDSTGRIVLATRYDAFPAHLEGPIGGAARDKAASWFGQDRLGVMRTFSSSPLIGHDIYFLLSAPSHGLFTWAWLNPVSAIALPVLAFLLALAAVWFVAERGVVRWIAYLQRIAAIYARGRFTVHPLQARMAPPEISDLAETLDAMAATILARDAALKESIDQKDELMREIHHRVKNNLQVISSLLNMQQRSLADPAARAAMSDTRQRISALALIYRALYEGPDLRHVDLRDFLDELIAQLIANEQTSAPIRTDLKLDPLVIDPDRLAPLALFAVEAITNAKKHGFGDVGGTLLARFAVCGDEARLTIADTGAPGVKPTVGEGVGRTLMTAFARQLRGSVSFCNNAEGGITATLVFPTRSPRAP